LFIYHAMGHSKAKSILAVRSRQYLFEDKLAQVRAPQVLPLATPNLANRIEAQSRGI
jgi:hypothetical protein